MKIPELIRDSFNARFERRELIDGAAMKIPRLYVEPDTKTIKTRKGMWKIFSDTGTGRFCGVYSREGTSRLLVKGISDGSEVIESTLVQSARSIFEQRPVLSRPSRSLNSENGLTFGIRRGFVLSVLLAVFIFFDYFLIPNYPEEILTALDITAGNEIGPINYDSWIFSYKSLTNSILERFFSEAHRHLATSMYTLVAVFVLPVLLVSIFYEFAGKRADRRRMKKLPYQAREFEWGLPAATSIIREFSSVRRERSKEEFYKTLTGRGLRMDQDEFGNLYERIFPQMDSEK